jgi:hypothetical protein
MQPDSMSPRLVRFYVVFVALIGATLLLGGAVWSPFGSRSGAVGDILGSLGAFVLGAGFLVCRDEQARRYARFPVGRFARTHSVGMVTLMGWGLLLIGVLALIDGVRSL